jgi:transposase
MSKKNIDIDSTIKEAIRLLREEPNLSPALRSIIKILIMFVQVLAGRIPLTSRNSNKPPSQDPNRKKEKKGKGIRKPGGQNGHKETKTHGQKLLVMEVKNVRFE